MVNKKESFYIIFIFINFFIFILFFIFFVILFFISISISFLFLFFFIFISILFLFIFICLIVLFYFFIVNFCFILSGSVSTSVIKNEEELNKILSVGIEGENRKVMDGPLELMVEKFVQGEFYHIDGLVFEGKRK